MPERIQLKDPGSELVLFVTGVKPEVVEKNEYFLFTNGVKELLVPQSSVKSQLPRLEVAAVNDLVGRAVKFSRSTKMSRAGKPYWNVDPATPDETATAKAAASAPANQAPANAGAAGAAVSPAQQKSYTAIYDAATKHVLEKSVKSIQAAGFTLTGTDVKEMIACLFMAKVKGE